MTRPTYPSAEVTNAKGDQNKVSSCLTLLESEGYDYWGHSGLISNLIANHHNIQKTQLPNNRSLTELGKQWIPGIITVL